MILLQIIFIALNIAMAWYHAKSFPVKHGLWGAYYLAAAYFATYLLTRSWIVSITFTPFFISFDWVPLVVFLSLITLRKPVFDIALNLFRTKGLWYVSVWTDSILDKFFIKVFHLKKEKFGKPYIDRDGVKRMYGAFTLLWAVLIIIYYLLNG